MKALEFTLVCDHKDGVKVSIDPSKVETVVDGKVMNAPMTTQIAMHSGRTFFVSHTYNEVRSLIWNLS